VKNKLFQTNLKAQDAKTNFFKKNRSKNTKIVEIHNYITLTITLEFSNSITKLCKKFLIKTYARLAERA
jgi:hypothetical protein